MKPQCTKCVFFEVNPHSDEMYCTHHESDDRQIVFEYHQQRRPKWCPLMNTKKIVFNTQTVIPASKEEL
jgi:hypothetical protein